MLVESLRLYTLCKEWNVLPVFGGIYDQDPGLLKEWGIISAEVAKVRKEEALEAERNTVTNKVPNQSPSSKKSVVSGKVGGVTFKRVPTVGTPYQRYYKQPKPNDKRGTNTN